MKKLIKKILKEDREQMYLNKIIHVMKNDFPLFKNMKDYGFYEQLSEEELNYVFSEIFGKPVRYSDDRISDVRIYDENGNKIYHENSYDEWYKYEYDENGNIIYLEGYDGVWEKKEYDNNGNVIYYENSEGYWIKKEYNENGDLIYHENSTGYISDRR